ncbi:MAG: hypothetical protein JXR40_09930 [Pontiellaceae bacterium]|nr:hypothetical protein [Pontiellaceae bacterium]
MMLDRMLRTTANARAYLDSGARREVVEFVRSRWNPDGGVRGRDERSDLYYTAFAAMCMRALRGQVPLRRLWNYVRSFDDGAELDAVHLFCLIRLRSIFPMTPGLRRRFAEALEERQAESTYDRFIRMLTTESLNLDNAPPAAEPLEPGQTTTNLAALAVIHQRPDPELAALIMDRFCATGGFSASPAIPRADLLSTGTALFALNVLEADLAPVRDACLDFIESLWRESGGFAAYNEDGFEDVEYTFYALLGIGCLME